MMFPRAPVPRAGVAAVQDRRLRTRPDSRCARGADRHQRHAQRAANTDSCCRSPRDRCARAGAGRPDRHFRAVVRAGARAGSTSRCGRSRPVGCIYPGNVAEYIYSLRKARKAHGDKVILDDVTLSFLPARRSAWSAPTARVSRRCSRSWRARRPCPTVMLLSPGYTVGILEQEPQLDESLNVLENVETGVARPRR